jgi:hypothetical protein
MVRRRGLRFIRHGDEIIPEWLLLKAESCCAKLTGTMGLIFFNGIA